MDGHNARLLLRVKRYVQNVRGLGQIRRLGEASRMTDETVAGRVKLLRGALGLTQEAMATAAGLERVVLVQVESGKNQASSYAIRAALAIGTDVPLEALADYLDGALPLRGLLALRGMRAASQWWRPIASAAAGTAPPSSSLRESTPSAPSTIRPKRRAGT